MASVAKLTEAIFADVCVELLWELNPCVSPAQWRRTFIDHGWHHDDYFGHVLLDGGKPVGVLGMLFSDRMIDGNHRNFCNVHAWYVKPQYRAQSLLLMRPALALRDHTITDFSPSPAVAKINRRLGLVTLDASAVILWPFPWKRARNVEVIRLSSQSDAADCRLTDVERRIFEDHLKHDCVHLVVRSGRSSCYVVGSRIEGRRVSYCDIHYLSNPLAFVEHHAGVCSALTRMTKTRCLVVESRLLRGMRIPYAPRLSIREKMFRPADVSAEQVDNLYSEIVTLKLSTLSGVKSQLRSMLDTCVKRSVSSSMP